MARSPSKMFYPCSECNFEAASARQLVRHKETTHDSVLKCVLCPSVIGYLASLFRRRREEVRICDKMNKSCRFCEFQTDDHDELIQHQFDVHQEILKSATFAYDNSITTMPANQGTPVEAASVPLTFNTGKISTLRRNELRNSNTKSRNNSLALQSRCQQKRNDFTSLLGGTLPNYNNPKPIITDVPIKRLNEVVLNRHGGASTLLQDVNSQPTSQQQVLLTLQALSSFVTSKDSSNNANGCNGTSDNNAKGDAWEKLKELGSSVPPPPESELFPVVPPPPPAHSKTIISPTGIQETNLDDVLDNPCPRPSHNESFSNNCGLRTNPSYNALFPGGSISVSNQLNSRTETNLATVLSQESLTDPKKGRAFPRLTRPTSFDDSSFYQFASSSQTSSSESVVPQTDADIGERECITRTDLDTPSPAFNIRGSDGSNNLLWVYPPNPNASTNTADKSSLTKKESNHGYANIPNVRRTVDSSAQTEPSKHKSHSHHHHHHHHHPHHSHSHHHHPHKHRHQRSLDRAEQVISANVKAEYNTESFRSEGSSGNSSNKRRHRHKRERRSEEDNRIALLKPSHKFIFTDTEEEEALNYRLAPSRKQQRAIIRKTSSFGSNYPSSRQGSLPDYYKGNSASRAYDKVLPPRLPSYESVTQQTGEESEDFESFPVNSRRKGSLPVLRPPRHPSKVDNVLSDFKVGVQKCKQKVKVAKCITLSEEDDDRIFSSKNKRSIGSEFDPSKLLLNLADEHYMKQQEISTRAKRSYKENLNDLSFDKNEGMRKGGRSSLSNKADENQSKSESSRATDHNQMSRDSDYENCESFVPDIEIDECHEEERKQVERNENFQHENDGDDEQGLASDDSDEIDSDEKSEEEDETDWEEKCKKLLDACITDNEASALDGVSVMNHTGLTDAESALSDVNSLLSDYCHEGDNDDTSMSSRSSSRMFDVDLLAKPECVNLLYDSEYELGAVEAPTNNIVTDDELGNTSDIETNYFSQQTGANLIAPTTLAERLENIRTITSNITRNFGHHRLSSESGKRVSETESEAN